MGPWSYVCIALFGLFWLLLGYAAFVRRLPIWMQRPYYAWWKRRQIARFQAGYIHPSIDQIVVLFFKERADVEFKIGGIARVMLAAEQVIELVASSFEFQMILAAEISQQMPNVSVTVIAVPPPDGEARKQG